MAALGQLGGNPSLVRALQGKLDGLAGKSSGFIEELHYKVKARVDQLDEIQDQHDELREKFLEERRALEERYRELYGIDLDDMRPYNLVVDADELDAEGVFAFVSAALR